MAEMIFFLFILVWLSSGDTHGCLRNNGVSCMRRSKCTEERTTGNDGGRRAAHSPDISSTHDVSEVGWQLLDLFKLFDLLRVQVLLQFPCRLLV